jgi:hypothetical protein
MFKPLLLTIISRKETLNSMSLKLFITGGGFLRYKPLVFPPVFNRQTPTRLAFFEHADISSHFFFGNSQVNIPSAVTSPCIA